MSALSSRGILQRLMTTLAALSSRDEARTEHAARFCRLKSDGHIVIVYAGIGKTVSIGMERRPEPARIAAPVLVGDGTQKGATK